MILKWLQSRIKMGRSAGSAPRATSSTILGSVPWITWFDSGLEVVVDVGRDRGRTLPLDHAFLVVGRTQSTDDQRSGWLLFRDETVSRRQAVFCWDAERNSFFLYHLRGATNPTLVGDRSDDSWPVGAGATVEMGDLRFRLQPRTTPLPHSAFVEGACARLGLGAPADRAVPSGFALTVIDGNRRGDTFVLSRMTHVLHHPFSPGARGQETGFLRLGHSPETEQALLAWDDRERAYRLVHNPEARAATCVFRGKSPVAETAIFAPVHGEPLDASPDAPVLLAEGDVLMVGSLRARLHRHVQPLLRGSIDHILQRGYIEKIPPADLLLARTPAAIETREIVVGASLPPGLDALRLRGDGNDTVVVPRRPARTESHPASEPAPVPSKPVEPEPARVQPHVSQARPRALTLPPAGGGDVAPRQLGTVVPLPLPTLALDVAPAVPGAVEACATTPSVTRGSVHSFALEAVVMPGVAPGTRLPVQGEPIVRVDDGTTCMIGTDPGCGLTFGDKGLCGQHAVLVAEAGRLLLRPLDGMPILNGTICVKDCELKDGDQVRLTRNTLLRVHLEYR